MRPFSSSSKRHREPAPAVLAGSLGSMVRRSRAVGKALPRANQLLGELDQLGGTLARASRVTTFGVGTGELMVSGRERDGHGAAAGARRCAELAVELEIDVAAALPNRRRGADGAIWRLSRADQPSFLVSRNARRSLRIVKSALGATRALIASLEHERMHLADEMSSAGGARGKRGRS